MLVKFTKKDVEELEAVARKRYYGNRARGIKNKKKFHKGIRPDIEGLFGEWAVCDALGLPRTGGDGPDDGFDIVVNSYTLDVKSSSYEKAHILIPYDKRIKSTHLCLAIVNVDKRQVWLAGGITSDEFFNRCKNMNFGHGRTQGLAQKDLLKWEEFADRLENELD